MNFLFSLAFLFIFSINCAIHIAVHATHTQSQPVAAHQNESHEKLIKQLYKPSLKFVYQVQEFLKYQWEMVPLLSQAKDEYRAAKEEAKLKKQEIIKEFGRNFQAKIQKTLELINASSNRNNENNNNGGNEGGNAQPNGVPVPEEFKKYEPEFVFRDEKEIQKLEEEKNGVAAKEYFGNALAEAGQLINTLEGQDAILSDNTELNEEIGEREKGIEECQRQIEALQQELDTLRAISDRRKEFMESVAAAKQEINDAKNIQTLTDGDKVKIYQQMLQRSRRNYMKFQIANHNLALIRITGKLLGTFTAQNFELKKSMDNNKRESQLEREAIRVLLTRLLPALAHKARGMLAGKNSREEKQGCVGTGCITALIKSHEMRLSSHVQIATYKEATTTTAMARVFGQSYDLETLESDVEKRVKKVVDEFDNFAVNQLGGPGALEFFGKMESEAIALIEGYLDEWDEKKKYAQQSVSRSVSMALA